MKQILRNIIVYSVIFLLSSSFLFGAEKKFSKAQLLQDFTFLTSKLEKNHIYLYRIISKENYKKLKNSIKKKIINDETAENFFIQLQPLFSSIGDGHTTLLWSKDIAEDMTKSNSILPVTVNTNKGIILVDKTYLHGKWSSKYKGYRILSINSNSSDTIYLNFMRLISGKSKTMNEIKISHTFNLMYFLYYNTSPEYQIKLTSKNKKTVTLNLKGAKGILVSKPFNSYIQTDNGFIKMSKIYFCKPDIAKTHQNKNSSNEFKLKFINKHTALLTINSFEGNFEQYSKFLNESFNKIIKNGNKNLIIDVRDNGGGDSDWAKLLIDHIFSGKYNMYYSVSTNLTKDTYAELELSGEQLPKFYLGKIRRYKCDFKKTFNIKNVFNGNIFILIGPGTFSSGVDFATVVKDYNIGTLVGLPTGGYPSTVGDSYFCKAPNTGITAQIAYKYFARANGLDTLKPLLPDYNIKDLKNIDALNITLNIINNLGYNQ